MGKIRRSLTWLSAVGGTISNVAITGGSITGAVISDAPFFTSTDPASSVAVATAVVNSYNGAIITLTGAGNAQTIGSPTVTTAGKVFTVVNNDTSTNPIAVNGITIGVGKSQSFVWDGSAWVPTDIGITGIPVSITQGGTGQASAFAALTALDVGSAVVDNDGATLVVGDLGKTYICDSGSSQQFNLPSVDASNIGSRVTFVKIGAGTLTIDAADSDTIDDSAAGATIYCSDVGNASITLLLAAATEWIPISATNTWITT